MADSLLPPQATQSELMSEMAESADLMDAIITQSEGQYSVEPEGAGIAAQNGQPPAHIADYLFYKTSVPGTNQDELELLSSPRSYFYKTLVVCHVSYYCAT